MSDHEYSQGIMGDGATILKDGQPMTVEEIVSTLTAAQTECEALLARVTGLVEALEVMTRVFSPRNGEPGPDMHAETEAHQLATDALAAYRNQGGK